MSLLVTGLVVAAGVLGVLAASQSEVRHRRDMAAGEGWRQAFRRAGALKPLPLLTREGARRPRLRFVERGLGDGERLSMSSGPALVATGCQPVGGRPQRHSHIVGVRVGLLEAAGGAVACCRRGQRSLSGLAAVYALGECT